MFRTILKDFWTRVIGSWKEPFENLTTNITIWLTVIENQYNKCQMISSKNCNYNPELFSRLNLPNYTYHRVCIFFRIRQVSYVEQVLLTFLEHLSHQVLRKFASSYFNFFVFFNTVYLVVVFRFLHGIVSFFFCLVSLNIHLDSFTYSCSAVKVQCVDTALSVCQIIRLPSGDIWHFIKRPWYPNFDDLCIFHSRKVCMLYVSLKKKRWTDETVQNRVKCIVRNMVNNSLSCTITF